MESWETELTKDFKTDSRIVKASEMDLQLFEACNRYKLLLSLPNPIIFQQVRSCMQQ